MGQKLGYLYHPSLITDLNCVGYQYKRPMLAAVTASAPFINSGKEIIDRIIHLPSYYDKVCETTINYRMAQAPYVPLIDSGKDQSILKKCLCQLFDLNCYEERRTV
jgi:hypothetical protein